MSSGGSTRAIIAALLANLGIAISKLVAFAFTGASSMLAEAVHSFADTGNQFLLLLGGRRASRPPTAEHPFGFGRERYFWGFVVAIVLFTLGAAFALYEGIEKVLHPHPLDDPAWAIGVLLVAIGLESFSFRTAIHEARPHKGDLTWPQFIRRSKEPELPVVLLEDLAALVGLLLALSAIGLTIVTDNGVWDGLGTVAIGLLLGVVAIVLAIEMKSLLIGEAADPAEQAEIEAALRRADRVRDVIFVRTQHFGPSELLVSAKVEFDPTLTMAELATTIDAAETAVRDAVPSARYLFIEPDVRRSATG